MELKLIAKVKNDFPTKFGLPRQSGLSSSLISQIVFEKEFSLYEAFKGIEDFSHLYVIWGFSKAQTEGWSPTVRPPRLGGNKRMGVFATRSPYRPNSLGITVVKLLKVTKDNGRIVLEVAGGDMMDGTPVYDIKPYLSFADSVPDAVGGFADGVRDHTLDVKYEINPTSKLPQDKLDTLNEILSQDPRPSYQNDPDRIYGFSYAGREVKFRVDGTVLTVTDII